MLWWTIQKLKSSDWKVRAEAARTLAASRQRKAVPALLKALRDGIGEEKPAVIEALGIIGHEGAVDALVSALKKQSRKSGSPGVSSGAADAAVCMSIAQALARIGSASLLPLLTLLDSGDKDVRRSAAHALGLLKDARALDPLVEKLQDARSEVRQEAARALGDLGDRRALQPLIKTLAGRDPEARRAAAEALGAIGAEEAVDPLAAAARDANEPLQLAAIEALRRIGGLRAGGKIRAVLETARKTVREAAAAALAAMKFEPAGPEDRAAAAVLRGDFEAALAEGPASAQALISALGSRDSGFRVKAVRALQALCPESGLQPLLVALDDFDRAVQEAASEALAAFGAAAIPGLTKSLASEHLSVRGLAARALGRVGEPRAAGPLVESLSDLRGRLRNESGASEAAQDAALALETILSRSAALVAESDLTRIAGISERESSKVAALSGQPGAAPGLAEITRTGELARGELRRRASH